MLKAKRKGLAKLASVLAMLPVTACCFFIGIPFGIWSLVLLSKAEIKSLFASNPKPVSLKPPQPPQF